MTALVYFMQPIGGGPIRIGYSKRPDTRLSHLTSFSPVKLEIITQFTASRYVEAWLHDHFREDRLHGEWFTPSLRLFEIIDAVKRNGWHPILPTDVWPKYNWERRERDGDKFRHIRKEVFCLTETECAEKFGVGLSTVRHWERTGPSAAAVIKALRFSAELEIHLTFADFFALEDREAA